MLIAEPFIVVDLYSTERRWKDQSALLSPVSEDYSSSVVYMVSVNNTFSHLITLFP